MRATVASLFVVFVVLCASGSASADRALAGRVTDLLGKPIAGARVHVLSGSEQPRSSFSVQPDDDGASVSFHTLF